MLNGDPIVRGELGQPGSTRDGWFSVVEIEINSHCNRRCWYCPNSLAPRPGPRLISDEQFELILTRLAAVEFSGRLSYHFYGEPLLHPRLAHFVERTRTVLPAARQVLYSNGDLLTEARMTELRRAGIDRFIVTRHDGDAAGVERADVVQLVPRDLVLTNRGGLIALEDQPARGIPCHAPATMLIITNRGNVVLCYEDARETEVLGNVFEQSLDEIWWSDRFVALRSRLRNGDRSGAAICRKCNNRAHLDDEQFDFVP